MTSAATRKDRSAFPNHKTETHLYADSESQSSELRFMKQSYISDEGEGHVILNAAVKEKILTQMRFKALLLLFQNSSIKFSSNYKAHDQ